MDPQFPIGIIDYLADDDRINIHWHNYLEIALCVKGRGRFLFSEKTYEVAPGDIFLAGNFENHVAVADPPETASFLLLLFRPELVAPPGARPFEQAYLRPFIYQPDSFVHKIGHEQPISGPLGADIRRMKTAWEQKADGYRNTVDVMLRKTLLTLMEHYRANADDSDRIEKLQQRIGTSLAYIDENYCRPIKLYQLAEMEHMCQTSYRRLFQEAKQLSYREYINYLRLTRAKQLLMQSGMSVTQVAQETGYTNINQFYKAFREYVGMLPAQYRKMH